jgi:hypothetical protein
MLYMLTRLPDKKNITYADSSNISSKIRDMIKYLYHILSRLGMDS